MHRPAGRPVLHLLDRAQYPAPGRGSVKIASLRTTSLPRQ